MLLDDYEHIKGCWCLIEVVKILKMIHNLCYKVICIVKFVYTALIIIQYYYFVVDLFDMVFEYVVKYKIQPTQDKIYKIHNGKRG